jgi:hypothetical protein
MSAPAHGYAPHSVATLDEVREAAMAFAVDEQGRRALALALVDIGREARSRCSLHLGLTGECLARAEAAARGGRIGPLLTYGCVLSERITQTIRVTTPAEREALAAIAFALNTIALVLHGGGPVDEFVATTVDLSAASASTLAEGRNPASAEGDAALVRGFARGVLARWAGGEQ